MSYVIYDKKTSKIMTQVMANGDERKYHATRKIASTAAVRMAKKGTIVLQEVEISDLDYYSAHIEQFREVKNIMSGQMVKESVNTPFSCSVASDAYWQN